MPEAFKINGPVRLKGEITPQGAKNEALQVVSAVLLTPHTVRLENVPAINDVLMLIEILRNLGVQITKVDNNTYEFSAANIDIGYLESPEFLKQGGSLRGSVMIMGPLLARFGKTVIPKPGGDKIGRRRMDTHFEGIEKLGARFHYDPHAHVFHVDGSKLTGTYILLDEPSVTGTANITMAAVLAKGATTIYNAACEPYNQQLCNMLVSMGARMEGIGTNRLTIHGVESLGGCTHRCLPDMIEIGSFMGMAAMTASQLRIKNVRYDMLGNIPGVFKKLGINFWLEDDDILVDQRDVCQISNFIDGSILTVSDGPWPLFTPDLISIALVTAIQAKGNVLIHQKMFESRLFFVDNLIDMGAQIILNDPHRATVMGLGRSQGLRGITMRSPDIRAGVALLIAAMSAHGESTIQNIVQIDRGYENIDTRLNALGAGIVRC
ncbi:MAG: UDP-N-acetylglucosamine 1-carboxyvinyltransferase [Bacteroidetes bacterium]|nr:UDP-N-acetylglucosamine 1-carboxyvinyltransferase [Bacteroidota bacterium]